MPKLIKDLTLEELMEWLKSIDEKPFRAVQIFEWIYKKNQTDPIIFTNLPLKLREKIKEEFIINSLNILKMEQDGQIIKFLFELKDKNGIESVFLPYRYGNAICISTQVGCNMNCAFCASAVGGKVRNLTPGEMIDQIINAEISTNQRISNIVLMGSGEPFDNADNVYKFIEIINCEEGKNIGARHITISTVGIIPEIYRLAEYSKQINLAISLHAPNNKIRDKLLPINKKYPIESILNAVDYYCDRTKRRVTFEYALIDGLNDQVECAEELSAILKNKLVHVNLIPINPVEGKDFKKPSKDKVIRFYDILTANGIQTTIRRELGSSISAACGQLRARYYNIS